MLGWLNFLKEIFQKVFVFDVIKIFEISKFPSIFKITHINKRIFLSIKINYMIMKNRNLNIIDKINYWTVLELLIIFLSEK